MQILDCSASNSGTSSRTNIPSKIWCSLKREEEILVALRILEISTSKFWKIRLLEFTLDVSCFDSYHEILINCFTISNNLLTKEISALFAFICISEEVIVDFKCASQLRKLKIWLLLFITSRIRKKSHWWLYWTNQIFTKENCSLSCID